MRTSVSICSVHTHSTFCDGKNTMAEMAAAACACGVRYFGFSGHSHTPIPHDAGNVLPADPAAYRAEALRLRQLYAGRMEILLGIEWDACSDVPCDGWDYWIGSVHNLFRRGEYCAVDWDREKLLRGRDVLFDGDIYALIQAYFEAVAQVAEKKPTILGHIDLICKLNGDGTIFDEEHPDYRTWAAEALECADPTATLLEINTGAIARGYRRTPYPPLWLLRRWRERKGRIIVTADAHSASQICYAYEEAAEIARAAGYSSACILTGDGIREVGLEERGE